MNLTMRTHLVRAIARTLLMILALPLASACSSGGAKASDAAVEAVARTCQEIRACIASGCGDGEQACIQRCIDMGSTDGKAVFQMLASCTAAQCPTVTSQCTCEQQCYAEGLCLDAAEACAGPTDLVCDNFCH